MTLTSCGRKGDVMPPEAFEVPESSGLGGREEGAEVLRPVTYARSEAPREMQEAAAKFERTFNIEFETLHFFSEPLLSKLHRLEDDPAGLPPAVAAGAPTDTAST